MTCVGRAVGCALAVAGKAAAGHCQECGRGTGPREAGNSHPPRCFPLMYCAVILKSNRADSQNNWRSSVIMVWLGVEPLLMMLTAVLLSL